MKKKQIFVIIQHTNMVDFQELINQHLSDGGELAGSMMIMVNGGGLQFFQPMMLVKKT